VAEVTYYGDMTYYDIALEGAPDTVSVSARNMPGRPVLERGEVTALAWDPRALTLFC
jgi:spermidine/putrescine transport system ATP-binding protein